MALEAGLEDIDQKQNDMYIKHLNSSNAMIVDQDISFYIKVRVPMSHFEYPRYFAGLPRRRFHRLISALAPCPNSANLEVFELGLSQLLKRLFLLWMNSTVECAVDDFNAFVKLLVLADRYSVVVAIPQPSIPQITSPSEFQLPRPNTKR